MEKNITIYVIRPTIPDYKQGDIYIGSTKFTMEKRFKQHKCQSLTGNSTCYSKKLFEKYGDNLEIIELEKCETENRYAREREWLEKMPCVNNNLAGRSKKESVKNWADNNRDWFKNYCKTDKHKDYVRQYIKRDYVKEKSAKKVKQYYENNKEKLNEKFNCDCGGRYTYSQKSTHFKSLLHQNYLNNNNVIIQECLSPSLGL